jgi:hypothetical protein
VGGAAVRGLGCASALSDLLARRARCARSSRSQSRCSCSR